MKERLMKSALTEFPRAGTTQGRQELKGKNLLFFLFKDPSYYIWTMQRIRNDGRCHDLYREMNFLLEAIETIRPIAKCRGGKRVLFWAVYEGGIVGHDTTCSDDDCVCRNSFPINRSTLAPYFFTYMYQFIKSNIPETIFLRGYKSDFGLPPRYNEKSYLSWLLDNVNFNRMKIPA